MIDIDELVIGFGAGGNSGEYICGGWSMAEPYHTWTIGLESALKLPLPKQPGPYGLKLTLTPFHWANGLRAQRLTVIVNGTELGHFVVRQQMVVKCALPWELIAGKDTIAVTFRHPDAARPIDVNGAPDDREIALAFESVSLARVTEATAEATAPPLPKIEDPALWRALVLGFENLGQNCEYGLVQRRCGAEPLGLLRFSSTPLPSLVAALEANFEGMGVYENLEVQLHGQEYMVLDKRYGLLFHAWVLASETTAEDVHARLAKHLSYLTRKLIDDLTEARKIFVYHGMVPLSETEMARLLGALRRYGPNRLLWVELCDAKHPPGALELVSEGLLKGYIDRFAPAQNAHDLSLEGWIAVCRAAESAA